jgi:hypothetical protein
VVYSRYPLWEDRGIEDEHGAVATAPRTNVDVVSHPTTTEPHGEGEHGGEATDAHEAHASHAFHLPAPTIFPLILAFGLILMAFALLFAPPVLKITFLITGVIYFIVSIYGWVRQVSD